MYNMLNTTHFSATEARKNFFEILRLAQKGKIVTIEKKDENEFFQLQKKTKNPKKNLVKIAQEMAKIGAVVPDDPQELKRIIVESKKIDLSL